MSTETLDPPAAARSAAAIAGPVTFGGLVRSEWIKFRSLRSSWYTLGAAAAAMIVLGVVIGYEIGRNPVNLDVEDTVASATLQGYALAQLLIGVLGALFVSGEYGTGAIRSSLVAAPRRTPVLLAKVVVFGTIALVTMVVASVLGFLAGEAVLSHYGMGYSLGDPTALRVSIGTGVYLTLVGVLGSAFGWIVRRTAGAISVLLGLLLVAPAIFGNLLGNWGKDVAKFLPSGGEPFIHSYTAPSTLAPWTGLGVTVAWVIGATIVAAIQLRRRDA
jgi:ABC-2 type transport system permease protein